MSCNFLLSIQKHKKLRDLCEFYQKFNDEIWETFEIHWNFKNKNWYFLLNLHDTWHIQCITGYARSMIRLSSREWFMQLYLLLIYSVCPFHLLKYTHTAYNYVWVYVMSRILFWDGFLYAMISFSKCKRVMCSNLRWVIGSLLMDDLQGKLEEYRKYFHVFGTF